MFIGRIREKRLDSQRESEFLYGMNTPLGLTPKKAIELLDQAIERRGLPASTGAHWQNAFKAVLPLHPDFESMDDISVEDPESFIRYYMMHTKDSHTVAKDRVSRFRSALQFVKDYHVDPRKAVESRKVKVRAANDKPKADFSQEKITASGNGSPPLFIMLDAATTLCLTGIPKYGLTTAQRAKLDHWLDLIPQNVPAEQ